MDYYALSQCRICDKSQKKFKLTQCRTKHSSGMKLVVKISREKMSAYQASIDIPPHPLMVLIVVKHIVRNTETVLYCLVFQSIPSKLEHVLCT